MGERGNIRTVEDEHAEIWFYTHWRGYETHTIVQKALKNGEDRWDDAPYLRRIIFQELIGNDCGNTGFGISDSKGDDNYPDVEVNISKQTITIKEKSWTFKDYIKEDLPKDIGEM